MARIYGKGTIKELSKGKKYYIALPCGKNPETGKYDKLRETFMGTRREAEHRLEDMRREFEQGMRPNADKMTYSQLSDEFIERREKSCESTGSPRRATIDHDRFAARHIVPRIGRMAVGDINAYTIVSAIDGMRDDGLGETTIHACFKQMKQILGYAAKMDIIISNPCDKVDAPPKPKTTKTALDAAEAKRLLCCALDGEPCGNRVAVVIAMATGMRLGEVLGLTWGNVSLGEDPSVSIVQQRTLHGKIDEPKTDSSKRTIPIDETTKAILVSWADEQKRQIAELNDGAEDGSGNHLLKQDGSTYVCTNRSAGGIDTSHFEQWFRRFCIANGFGELRDDSGRRIVELTIGESSDCDDATIVWKDAQGWPCDADGKRYSRSYKRPEIKTHYDGLTFHELRHTHFTLQSANGVDVKTIQARGGWASASIPMNVYVHPLPDNERAAADIFGKVMAEAPTPDNAPEILLGNN